MTEFDIDFAMLDEGEPLPQCGNCRVPAESKKAGKTLTCPKCGYTLTRSHREETLSAWIRMNRTEDDFENAP